MRVLTTLLLLSAPAFCQSHPKEFEVASIKPSDATAPGRLTAGIRIDGAQVSAKLFSLRDYVFIAWKVKPHQVVGPEWINSQRFDIAAKLPEGASRADVPEMLQALLKERFNLKVHNDKKEFPVYALVQAKGGHHMKESEDKAGADGNVNVTGGGDARGTSVSLGNGSSYVFMDGKLSATKLNMEQFADSLARFMDRPIVDFTDLKGSYDFTLDISEEDFRAMQIRSGMNAGVQLPPQVLQMAENASYESLHSSLLKAGLRLEPRKAPLDVIVVDSADKSASGN